MTMTLSQAIQAAPEKAVELITKLSATSNQAVKNRESLFADLSGALTRYVDAPEQHLLPQLQRRPDTSELAMKVAKGTKDLRASLEKLSGLPKNSDVFPAALAELNKSFQQHIDYERKELLPALLKVLSEEEATALAGELVGDVEVPENAKREREVLAERQAEAAEQAAAYERAVALAQKEAERAVREASEKMAEVMERGAVAAQDRARQVTETLTERGQKVASDTREALTIYSDSARKMGDDMQVVTTSSVASMQAVSDATSPWMDWLGKAVHANAEASQQLIGAKSFKAVAEVQRELATSAMHNWMNCRTTMLQIAQRASDQALNAQNRRDGEAA